MNFIEQNVEVHIRTIQDVRSLSESYHETRRALQEARVLRGSWPASVDITGGTATMSVGIALAAREEAAAIQYYPSYYDAEGNLRPGSADAPLLVALVTPLQENT